MDIDELFTLAQEAAEKAHCKIILEISQRLEKLRRSGTCKKCTTLHAEYIALKLYLHRLRSRDATYELTMAVSQKCASARENFHTTECTCGKGDRPKWNKTKEQLRRHPLIARCRSPYLVAMPTYLPLER